ncbi:MAG TPA: hypothetical protein VGE72_16835 [Azospirillum sp.]
MLRLGTKVRIGGQEALVVARTLAGVPSYDVRLSDGRLVKYAAESDLEVMDVTDALPSTLQVPGQGRPLNAGRGA